MIFLQIKDNEEEKPFFNEKISYFSLYNNFLILPGKYGAKRIKLNKYMDLLYINGKKKDINLNY